MNIAWSAAGRVSSTWPAAHTRCNADSHAQALAGIELVVQFHQRLNALSQAMGGTLITTRHQRHKFVSANTRHAIGMAGRGTGQHLSGTAQHSVSGSMAIRVVDWFEAIY